MEQAAFLKDPTQLAALVDDLLARPSYGERWGRHWLDVVRYAETNGYERDATKPNAWRYRDYVIRAFNQDKPFNRFILEQLAGDELPDASAETFVALGYYRLGPWDDEPADVKEDRFDQLDDIVSTTSQAFLGLDFGCARCHDHKFEALTARDYYSMVAIFNGLERPRKKRQELDLPIGTWSQIEAERERDRKIAALEKEGNHEAEIDALLLATPDLPRGYYMEEPNPQPPPAYLLIRGKSATPGPEVTPAVPAVLVREQPEFPLPQRSSLRRLTLAEVARQP